MKTLQTKTLQTFTRDFVFWLLRIFACARCAAVIVKPSIVQDTVLCRRCEAERTGGPA